MRQGESPSGVTCSATERVPAGRATRLLLALIVLLGLGVRLQGLDFLAPHLMEPDGLVVDYQLRALEGGGPEHRAHALYAYYPHLVARVAALVPTALVAEREPRTLAEHLDFAGRQRLRGRVAVALLSLLAIPLSFWLARRFLPDPWPLAAAAITAASPFTLWFAQQARPHAAAASFTLLAVCAAVVLRASGSWRAYAAAGLAAGLAVGALQNGVAALCAVGFAVLARVRADRWRAAAGALLITAVVAAFVAALYPFLFAEQARSGVAVDERGTLALSQHQVFLGLFNGRGFPVVWRSLEEYDPLLTVLSVLGMLAALVLILRGRSRLGPARAADLAVVLAYVLPYLVVIGLYQRTYQRFVLPLVPFLAVLAAFGLHATWRAASARSRWLGRAVAFLAVVACVAQFAWAFRLGAVRAAPDTIEQAARWIEEHVAPGTDRVDVMPGLDLPLSRTPASIERDAVLRDEQSTPWFRHLADPRRASIDAPAYDLALMDLIAHGARQRAHGDAYGFARSLTGRYAVVIAWPQRYRPALRAVREGLRGQFELVARFNPDDPDTGEDLPLAHQDDELPYTTPWALRILEARCVGPSVEIYRLR
ncbi:MAG: glycosyltransferase family 39 protein [Planctomycetes bacterium]|nr:glycosyltransferase family 39 protein [Planctomycetota bacterium]